MLRDLGAALDQVAGGDARALLVTGASAVKVFYMAGPPIPREVAQAFSDIGLLPQNVTA